MSDPNDIPSRLGQKRRMPTTMPVTGMGSGVAANQKLHGAQDPEAAARVASSPEAAREAAEDATRRRTLTTELLMAWEDGIYAPPGYAGTAESERDKLLRSAETEVLEELHKKMTDARNERIADSTLAEAEAVSMMRGVGDPFYDAMNDTERRKAIEANLKPIDMTSMLFRGYCEQTIKTSEHITVTMRTISGVHGLWLERMVTDTEPKTTRQYERALGLFRLSAALQTVNNESMGEPLDGFEKEGEFAAFEAAIEKRAKKIGRWPDVLLDDLLVNQVWFTIRLRQMLAGDLVSKVGNS